MEKGFADKEKINDNRSEIVTNKKGIAKFLEGRVYYTLPKQINILISY